MISSGKPSNYKGCFTGIVSEADVLGYYIGINCIPCVISSPLRTDNKPSFALYSPDGKSVNYIDFGNNDRGSCMTLLMKLFNLDYNAICDKIQEDIDKIKKSVGIYESHTDITKKVTVNTGAYTELKCKVREWRDYDIKYWASFGISLEWLKWAEVYPISHKIIVRNGREMVFRADKYAYTFVERKEGRITHKFYQPFNTNGYKWQNSHDKSVLGLWAKMPPTGDAVCICSSVKDALCLMANIHIPCICLQGEGYPISDTAAKELKRRFTDVFICLDNDEAGLKDAYKLSESTGFINVVIPSFDEGKDISDYYRAYGEVSFKTFFKKLISEAREEYYNELPF